MRLITEFRKFALRGNVIDLAVGFTVGAAFTTIATSLVNDIIMPPIGLILGQTDFTQFYVLLEEGAKAPAPYATLADAQAAGAVTLNYGVFVSNVLAFVLVALSMFVLIRAINEINEKLEEEFGSEKPQPQGPSEKKCPFCLTTVAFKAVRCPACTSQLEVASASA